MLRIHSGEKKEELRGVGSDGVCPPSHHSLGWGPVVLKVLNTCLLMGSGELIPCFSFLVLHSFCFLYEAKVLLFFILTQQFSSFCPPDSSLLWLVGE